MTGKNPLAYETRNNTYELLKPAEPRAGKVAGFFFAGGAVMSLLCPTDEQQKDNSKRRVKDTRRRGQIQRAKDKTL